MYLFRTVLIRGFVGGMGLGGGVNHTGGQKNTGPKLHAQDAGKN